MVEFVIFFSFKGGLHKTLIFKVTELSRELLIQFNNVNDMQ